MNEDRMTKEEFLANRKAAGRVIDPDTCDIAQWYVDLADPYGVNRRSPAECIGRVTFVASAESDGWVLVEHLPPDTARALHDRIKRRGVEQEEELPWE